MFNVDTGVGLKVIWMMKINCRLLIIMRGLIEEQTQILKYIPVFHITYVHL